MKTVLLAIGLSLAATAASAETFKCGKTYQDHPCAGSQTKSTPKHHHHHHHHSSTGTTTPAPTPTPTPTPPSTTPAPAPTPTPPVANPAPAPAPTPAPTPPTSNGAAGCGLASAAFCETFETAAPGGNGGELDETKWAVARWGIGYQLPQIFHRPLASTQSGFDVTATFCGAAFSNIAVGQDYRICNGVDGRGNASRQLNEVIQDGGDNIYVNSMMIRQPFDFTNRTGTLVFEVDAKIFPRNDGHGWWNEVWISEDPQPLPYQKGLPSVSSVARNSIGFVFQGTNWWPGCNKADMVNGITDIIVSNNYQIRELISTVNTSAGSPTFSCFKFADSKLNHFEIRINTQSAEIWASDAGQISTLKRILRVDNLNLNFTRGYVSLQHTHYNARKTGTTPSQTYRWDNIGFDGPVLPALSAYDVPLPVKVQDGAAYHGIPISPAATLTINNVDLKNATKAFLNFNLFPALNIAYSVNGNAWHTVKDPLNDVGSWSLRGFSIPVALSELRPGVNSIQIKSAGDASPDLDHISNVDLSIQRF